MVDGVEGRGLSVCNVPVGSEAYVKGYLGLKGRKVRKGLTKVTDLLNPVRRPHPEIPSRQMFWMLLSACLQFTGDYWLQHVRPDWTKAFANGVKRGVEETFGVVADTGRDTWSQYTVERIGCP